MEQPKTVVFDDVLKMTIHRMEDLQFKCLTPFWYFFFLVAISDSIMDPLINQVPLLANADDIEHRRS